LSVRDSYPFHHFPASKDTRKDAVSDVAQQNKDEEDEEVADEIHTIANYYVL
jgi:hypothetical protein